MTLPLLFFHNICLHIMIDVHLKVTIFQHELMLDTDIHSKSYFSKHTKPTLNQSAHLYLQKSSLFSSYHSYSLNAFWKICLKKIPSELLLLFLPGHMLLNITDFISSTLASKKNLMILPKFCHTYQIPIF